MIPEIFSVPVALAVLLTALLWMYVSRRLIIAEKGTQVPGPSYLYGFGPLLTSCRFLWMGIPEAATYYVKRYGDFTRVWISGTQTFLTTRPSIANHVLKTNGNNYCLRFGCDEGLRHIGMYGNGIIWNNDLGRWKLLRSFFQKALNADTLNVATAVSIEATKRKMAKIPELQKRRPDGSIEALDFIRRITLDVTNTLMLKVEIEDDEDLVSRIVVYFKAWEFFLIKPSWMYRLSWGSYVKHVDAVRRLNEAIEELIEKKKCHMTSLGDRSEEELDFTESLLQSEKDGRVTAENTRQCVLEMMLAGTDTSSVSIYYLLVALSENPEVERKIVEEIEDVIGDRDVTKADIPKLVYMESAIKESMRIKPVGPVIIRRAQCDDVIDGHATPAGSTVILNLAQMHRREETFPVPNYFDPGHFIGKNFQSEYVPFGTGPKGCIGQFLAMIEMKTILCTLLRKYSLRSCGQTLGNMMTKWDIAQQPTESSFMFFVPRN